MDKIKKIIKILLLVLLGIGIIYNTYYFIDTLIITYKQKWFFTEIYSKIQFSYDLINILAYYFIWILSFLYLFFKNKISNNNDFIQGVRFLCILISIGLIIKSINLAVYDINNILYSDEQLFYGDTIYTIGFTVLFVYLTLYLKKYLLENCKINKFLIGIGIVLIIIGFGFNIYLNSVY